MVFCTITCTWPSTLGVTLDVAATAEYLDLRTVFERLGKVVSKFVLAAHDATEKIVKVWIVIDAPSP